MAMSVLSIVLGYTRKNFGHRYKAYKSDVTAAELRSRLSGNCAAHIGVTNPNKLKLKPPTPNVSARSLTRENMRDRSKSTAAPAHANTSSAVVCITDATNHCG